MVATSEQRQAFREKLRQERQQRGWSQRELARALGLSHSSVSYWEQGKGLPTPSNVIDLERVLDLESGTLARLLGYMPVATMRDEMIGVLDAIMGDPELGARERDLLATMYRQLIRQRRTEMAERESRQSEPRSRRHREAEERR